MDGFLLVCIWFCVWGGYFQVVLALDCSYSYFGFLLGCMFCICVDFRWYRFEILVVLIAVITV